MLIVKPDGKFFSGEIEEKPEVEKNIDTLQLSVSSDEGISPKTKKKKKSKNKKQTNKPTKVSKVLKEIKDPLNAKIKGIIQMPNFYKNQKIN